MHQIGYKTQSAIATIAASPSTHMSGDHNLDVANAVVGSHGLGSDGVDPFRDASRDFEVCVHSGAIDRRALVFAIALAWPPRQRCASNCSLKNAPIYGSQSLSYHIKS